MVKNSPKGFTLVEAVISMLIIAMVAIGAIPVLTKKAPEIEKVSLRGQYACFVDDGTYGHNGKLMEWYFDERTPRTVNPIEVETQGCKLKLDKRPAGYYIIATGAGKAGVFAQVKTQYVSSISNQLDIQLGRTNAIYSKDTVINTGSSGEMIAAGAESLYSDSSGVLPDNIKTCRLIQAPSCAKSCQVVDEHAYNYTLNAYISEPKVRINGCNSTISADASQNSPTLISFNSISFEGFSGTANFNNVNSSTRNTLSNSNNNYYSAIGLVNGANTSFKLAFDFINSTFTKPQNELGFKNNTVNIPTSTTKSKMTKLIEMISIRRQSELTRFLVNLNPGAENKNGAVLILW